MMGVISACRALPTFFDLVFKRHLAIAVTRCDVLAYFVLEL
jgi:hypothetical protein